MSILFAGTPENAAVSLRELYYSGVPISLVLTREDAPVGRKAILTQSPVAEMAAVLGLPLLKANRVNSSVLSEIKKAGIDTALVVAYGVLLDDEAIGALRNGWYNLHYSLLPMWRGAAPVQHSILNGDAITGVTIFKIDAGLDTGAIAGSVSTEIVPNETAADLLGRLSLLGVTLALEALPAIVSNTVKLIQQNHALATYAPKIGRQDARLDIQGSAIDFERKVRAMNPEPGAWIEFGESTLKIFQARALPSSGRQVGFVELLDGKVILGLGQGSVEILDLQPAGKQRMSAKQWILGIKSDSVKFE